MQDRIDEALRRIAAVHIGFADTGRETYAFDPPANADGLEAVHAMLGRALPRDLLAVLGRTSAIYGHGFSLDLRVDDAMPAFRPEHGPDGTLYVIYDWGNGDCAYIDPGDEVSRVVWVGHDPPAYHEVAGSLVELLEKLADYVEALQRYDRGELDHEPECPYHSGRAID